MKTLQQINSILDAHQKKYGTPIAEIKQGSKEWLKLKLGVLSASKADCIVAKADSDKRATYMAELVAQVCTGDSEELVSKYLDWGKDHEDAARSSYEFSEGVIIQQVPFVYMDENHREGCSPDGIIGEYKGVEIKCPYNASHYIKFLTEDKIKPEYVWQYQFCMRVTGATRWDFVQYHPNMRVRPLKVLLVEIDEQKQKTFEDAVPQFISDMDKMLSKIGVNFGDQWRV